MERVVAHNPQPPQKDNGITTDLFNTYGYLYVQVTYPRRRRIRIWSCLTPTEASGYLYVRDYLSPMETYISLVSHEADVHKKAHAAMRGLVSFRHPNGTSAARKAE